MNGELLDLSMLIEYIHPTASVFERLGFEASE